MAAPFDRGRFLFLSPEDCVNHQIMSAAGFDDAELPELQRARGLWGRTGLMTR